MVQNIDFVEDDDEGQLRFVEYGETVHHIRHESVGILATHRISDIQTECWEGAAEGLGDNLSRGRLAEGFNLARRVDNDVAKTVNRDVYLL